ncbi:MAG: hypothetical protein CMG49_01880 [Candidatus Marinimicrobia bacterium]|nr:hypothetical protein [Candidatus Neomarinimicrobiota bacterium]|tara:strand:+ start:2778 stop:3491 length:714 start_codon:yes stop_codon:yes gene_type:complete
MLWPWEIISKLFSLNFTYRINFDFDHQKILDEYINAKNKLIEIKHPSIGIDHDGGWKVVSLYSETGSASSVDKKFNSDTAPTEIIKFFTYTHKIIRELLKKYDCKPRRIRFSTLKPKKQINWHRDWDESIRYNNSRLHLPLIVNENCKSKLCHESYQWQPGGLYYGDYSFPHQIKNEGMDERLHLIIDLKNPKNLFTDLEKFSKDQYKREKYKNLIILTFNIFYKYPRKIIRLLSFK